MCSSASDEVLDHGRIKTMGVNKFGIGRLMPEMSNGTHCTDSSVAVRRVLESGEVCKETSTPSLHIFDGAADEADLGTHQLQNKMRWKLGQDELARTGVTGYSAECGGGTLTNLLVRTGVSHELSMSLPNLTAALDTDLLNRVNERNVRSSLSNIFDGKAEACKKNPMNELSNCVKTLSTEHFKMHCDGQDIACSHKMQGDKEGICLLPSKLHAEEIKIEMNGGNNRLSAVLENIPLLYIPHTKQLVSITPRGTETNANSSNSTKSPPTSPTSDSLSDPSKLHNDNSKSVVLNSHGDAVTPAKLVENGITSTVRVVPSSFNSPIPPQNYVTGDSSFDDSQNLLPSLEHDGSFALSQDSDASSTCRSEHTVINQDDIESQEREHEDSKATEDDDMNLDSLSKESVERDSPRNTLERTNTIGSLSKADASSFSSISSISTATDFSASAASCSDDYLDLRVGGDVDESGFMEVNLHSRNTFERSKNSSQDSGIDEKQCPGAKAKRRGISSFFAR